MILNGLNEDNKSMQDPNTSRNIYKSLDPRDFNKSNATYVNQLKNEGQTVNYYGTNSPKK